MTHTPATVDVPRECLSYQYIQWCNDAEKLEQIYTALKSGILGSYPLLEPVTLNRIQQIHPTSEILQQALFNNRQQQDHPSTASPLPSEPGASPVNILEELSKDAPSVEVIPVAENIYNGNEPSSIETESPEQPKKFEDDQNQPTDTEIPPSETTAERYFLDGKSAFEANNCHEAIELFTKSLALDTTNPEVYMGRALAYFDLNDMDASISDCSQVLALQPEHQEALSRRAACFLTKQEFFEAQTDLIQLFALNPNHLEGTHLSNMIGALQEADDSYSPEIGRNNHSPAYPRISSNSTSDLMGDMQDSTGTHRSHNSPENIESTEAQESLLDDRKDEIPSGNRLGSIIQEGPRRKSVDLLSKKSLPSVEDEPEPSEASSDEATLANSNYVDHNINDIIAAGTPGRKAVGLDFTTRSIISYSNHSNKVEYYHQPSVMSTNNSWQDSYQKTSSGMESFDNLSSNTARSSKNNTMDEAISNSNFSPTIQSWLRDSVRSQLNDRLYSYYDRPWSSALIPWSLEGIYRDLNRYHRYQETSTAIDVAKIMLKNGILDYHQHAEYIVNALVICAESYFEWKEYPRTIRYASEALEYDKNNIKALMARARAFEKQNLPLFSYADYVRVPHYDFEHYTALRASEKLAIGLEESKGETWREQLPKNLHEDGFFTYLQTQEDSSANDFYQTIADQLYADACFVLAIQCYTRSIELAPDDQVLYARRAACYVKVFEHQKAIADCDRILNDTDDSFNILYCKARALKIARDSCAYEATLKQCLKLQPSNQILLTEYHSERHEAVPRKKRRLRLAPSPSKIIKTGSMDIHSKTPLSFGELEQLREQISEDPVYTLQAQLDLLKSDDIEGQCAFVLRLSENNMIETFAAATEKLVDTILDGSRTMIELERNYREEHPSLISPFSYVVFSFRIVRALRKLPKIEEMWQWIVDKHRTKWNELEEYFSSSPALTNEIEQIFRLQEGTVE